MDLLTVRAPAEALAALTPLAREGFRISVAAGRTLRQTLTGDLGLDSGCVEQRIQTVFLDGSPVDDIDQDHARPGCVLALAGALPGVAGIAMRRGSPVGVFREGITHHAGLSGPGGAKSLDITLKLFNSVAVECLAAVLSRGVGLRSGRLAELLDAEPDALAGAEFALNGQPMNRAALAQTLRGGQSPLRLEAHP